MKKIRVLTGILASMMLLTSVPALAQAIPETKALTTKTVKLDGVEVGTNANGTYYKYDNGILVCTIKNHYMSVKYPQNTSLYYNRWTYPMEFFEEPTITMGAFVSGTHAWFRDHTNTYADVFSSDKYRADMVAIGTWKDIYAEESKPEYKHSANVNLSDTFSPYEVRITGEIKGNFADGSNQLNATDKAAQNLTIVIKNTQTGEVETKGIEAVQDIRVNIVNDQITGFRIYGPAKTTKGVGGVYYTLQTGTPKVY